MDLSSSGYGLYQPDVLTLYGAGYSAGARVHSNSWGSYFSGAGYYSGGDVDSYLYTHTVVAFFTYIYKSNMIIMYFSRILLYSLHLATVEIMAWEL